MSRALAVALLVAAAVALGLRLPELGVRPLHNDEAVNAVKLSGLWDKGQYAYDPHEFHGPTLYYASVPVLWLSGARSSDQFTDARLRLAPVFFGAGLVLLTGLLVGGLGRVATGWAALFVAISPAMVFYSRYLIHEILLVFFTALALGSGWRYWQTRKIGWAILGGVGLGLMYATKETFVLALVAAMGGIVATRGWNRCFPSQIGPVTTAPGTSKSDAENASSRNLKLTHLLLAAVVAVIVGVLFFTSFFTHGQGLMDSVRTYTSTWIQRAGETNLHAHPWNFYLERLVFFHRAHGQYWSEAAILILAVIGGGAALTGKFRRHGDVTLGRFLTFYTLLLTAGYTIITYKTPWCLLGFWHGFILLAGMGAAVVLNWSWRWQVRWGMTIVLIAAAGHLAWQAGRGGMVNFSERTNPYAYSQTSTDALRLVELVKSLGQVHPDGNRMQVKVVSSGSYWPLPWYLRQFRNTGWWDDMPADVLAPVILGESRLQDAFDAKLKGKWVPAGLFELRPGYFLDLYVELELWKKYLATRPVPKD